MHRIGRTARAGADGIALSFCDQEEREFLVDIERLSGKHIPRVLDHAYVTGAPPPMTDLARRGGGGPRPQQSGGGGGRPQHGGGRPHHGGGGGRRHGGGRGGGSHQPRPR